MSNMFKYVKNSSKFMMEGVKSLVVGHRKLPVTRTVDCLSELKQTPETDSFLALDPKIYRKSDNLLPALKNTFNDVSNFVLIVDTYRLQQGGGGGEGVSQYTHTGVYNLHFSLEMGASATQMTDLNNMLEV